MGVPRRAQVTEQPTADRSAARRRREDYMREGRRARGFGPRAVRLKMGQGEDGGPCRNRTYNQLIKSQLLYQLS